MEKLPLKVDKRTKDESTIGSRFNSLRQMDYETLNRAKDHILLIRRPFTSTYFTTDATFVKNTCNIINNLIKNNTLNRSLHKTCLEWLLEARESCEPDVKKDTILTLQTILNMESLDIDSILQTLLMNKNLIFKYSDRGEIQCTELIFQTIAFFGKILKSEKNDSILPKYIDEIKRISLDTILSISYPDRKNQFYNKIIHSCLQNLYTIVSKDLVTISSDFIGELLGVIQAFMFHGIEGYEPVKPQCLHPAAMNLPEPVRNIPKCKNLKDYKGKSNKRSSNKVASDIRNDTEHTHICKYSSDSDTSDSELYSSICYDWKVRLASVHLLQVLVEKTQSGEIFGYWPQIVSTGSRNHARVLTRSVSKEPMSKIRQIALNVLTELLLGAKTFLIHAEDSQPKSFSTFFGTVYLMIKELHFTLSIIVSTEKNVAVLMHSLKCVAALVQGVKYARLKPGLATNLMKDCRPHLLHRDPTVRVAAFSAFEALASNDPITPEILDILAERYDNVRDLGLSRIDTLSSRSEIETEEEEEEEVVDIENVQSDKSTSLDKYNVSTEKNMSSLVYLCLKNISNQTTNVSVRVKSLKVIGRMAFSTGKLIFPNLELITPILLTAVKETEIRVVLQAVRVLEIMSGCLSNNNQNDDSILFWNAILDSIVSLTRHAQAVIREAAYDCLGSIGANALSQLSRQKTILIITVLFNGDFDKESGVRAATIRALGMIVTLPSLRDDTGFLMDLANKVCSASQDQNLGVRIKAAWTLANLCDCIVQLRQDEIDCCESTASSAEPLDLENLLPRLYEASVKGAKDNNKVKCNAVRAVGTILHLCAEKKMLKDTSSGLAVLIDCATVGHDMKVRWNACRALGLVLKDNPDDILPPTWRDQVLPMLCTLICQSPNFKVRTHAAWALSSCKSYGKYTVTIWKSIVLAMENSQHVPSYIEYSHQDDLIRQLCLTLCHVVTCTKESELGALWTEISDYSADLSGYMKRFQEGILPERLGDLIEANAHLQAFVKNSSTVEGHRIAETLLDLFQRIN